MKRIGILYDKDSKKAFLLPDQVRELTSKGINVNITEGLGKGLGIPDTSYLSAGARIYKQYTSVIEASDIILKASAFVSGELAHMKDKIAITTANFLANVDMLYFMLINKVTGCEWMALTDKGKYVIFPEIEEAKAQLTMTTITQAMANGFKHKYKYPQNPKMLILNATYGAIALAKLALNAGYDVTIADNDTKYLETVKQSLSKISKTIHICDANYETLLAQVKDKNIYVATTINPTDLTKLRITQESPALMVPGSMLIDMSCQNGYAFHFIKKFAKKELEWIEIDKRFYLAPADMSELIYKTASEIISKNSVQYLIDIAKQGTVSSCLKNIINCQEGKVISALINKKLNLY